MLKLNSTAKTVLNLSQIYVYSNLREHKSIYHIFFPIPIKIESNHSYTCFPIFWNKCIFLNV